MDKFNPNKIAIGGIVLTVLLLSTFVLVQPAFACPQLNPQDISVQQAKRMINHSDVVILDVRNQSEYELGYLDGAILIPVHELELRLNELSVNQNDKIIVYCAAGSRSSIACQILATHDFTHVYNMVGGITAWMGAGYQIKTRYHFVTVDTAGNRVLTQIDPLLMKNNASLAFLPTPSCGCSPGSLNSSAVNTNITVIDSATVSEGNVTNMTYTISINGTELETLLSTTLIANETANHNNKNTTLFFTNTQISNSLGDSSSYYTLTYTVVTNQYYFEAITHLTPIQNSDEYNSSFTQVMFGTGDNSSFTTVELVQFNCSVTLSQLYADLSKVADRLSRSYEGQGLNDISDNYHKIATNLNKLANAVERNLGQYNNEISDSKVMIQDARITACAVPAGFGAYVIFYCNNTNGNPDWVVQSTCCATLYGIALSLAAACILTAMVACIVAIGAAVAGQMAALAPCYQVCPSMTVCFWFIADLYCLNLW
jgi:rhodanese-related sulfurtransferase/uncharacterized protein YukE